MAREAALLAEPHAPQFLHAEGGTVTVPDAHLLFTADFHRSGHDLILTGDHGDSAVIADYFGDAGTPALVAPHGAMLTPEVVCALAGSAAPGQYAQTGASQAVAAIGKVAELTGTATAQRADGTIVELHTGDALAAGDVLRTGADSKLSVLFIDGAIFNLTADARMVLNNLVYQEGGTSNSMTLSLVQGTFSFVAGQVAPTGEMRVDTPVATMGIRGTSGIVKVGTINGITIFRIVPDPVTNHLGAYVLFNLNNPSLILATVDNPALALLLDSPNGVPQPIPADTQVDEQILKDLVKAYENFHPQGPTQPEEPERHGSNDGGGTLMQVTPTAAEIAMFAALALDPLGDDQLLTETPLGETDTAPLTTTTLDTGTPPNQPDQTPPDNGPTTIGGETTGNVVDGGTDTTGGQLIVDSPGGGNAGVQPLTNVAGEFGTFSVDAAGNWTYVLNGNDPDVESLGEGVDATDSFVVTSADGTASKTIVVTVEGTNDDPVAAADTASATEDGALVTGTVAGNDSDPDTGAILSYALESPVAGLTLNADGSYSFDPSNSAYQHLAAGETLQVVANYAVTDEHGASDNSTLTITVEGTNGDPVAAADTASTDEDTAVNFSVLGNDSDPDTTDVLSVTGASITNDAQGSVVVNGDNTLSYDPGSAYNYLAVGESAAVEITYQISDGHGGTSSAVATVTVTGSNDAPTAAADATSTDEDTAVNFSVLGNDSDPDTTDVLSVTGASITNDALGSVVVNGDNTLSYDPGSAYNYLAVGESAAVEITYQISDGHGGTSSAVATVTVTGSNDGPDVTLADLSGAISGTGGTGSAPLTETAASYLTHGNTLVNGLGGTAGFGENFLAANDDGSTAAIDLTAMFGSLGISFFGADYTTLYINNNGNVTFAAALDDFTPTSITGGTDNPIIAPFWADVDTRGGLVDPTEGGTSTGSNLVWYDVDSTNSTLTVTWDDVGFYNNHTNPLNAFQLQLVGTGNGNFDIVFRYEDINWTTGDVSGGIDARAGYTAGDGDHYFELPQSGDQEAMQGLPGTAGNTGIQGVDVFHVIGGEVDPTTLTDTGVITFTDEDIHDEHTVSPIGTYLGDGTALGTLTVNLDSDTTNTGTGGQLTWTYSVESTALDSINEGDTKVEQFEISIDDQHGGVVKQTISVTLNGTGNGDFTAQFAAGDGPSLGLNDAALRGPSSALAGLVDFTALPHTELSNGPSSPSDHRLAFPSLASVLDLGGDTNSATIAEFTRSAHNDNPNPVHAAATSAPLFSGHDSSPHADAAHHVSMSDVTASVSGGHEHAAHHPTA